jgi:hypothetical protein
MVLMNDDNDIIIPEQMLNAKDYARHVGASDRSIKRWLAAGELPGARMIDGAWAIPVSTMRQKGLGGDTGEWAPSTPQPAGNQVAVSGPSKADIERAFTEWMNQPRATMEQRLAEENIFIPLERAADLLGLSVYEIRKSPEDYGAVRRGAHGAYVIPKAQLRHLDQHGFPMAVPGGR